MTPKSWRLAVLLPLLALAVFSCSEKQFTEPDVNPPGGGGPPPPSGRDSIPPSVSQVSPGDHASGVDRATVVSALFSEPVAESTATTSTFQLQGSAPVAGVVTVSGSTVSFAPSAPLSGEVTYTATLTTGIHDRAGNPLPSSYSWTFTTQGQAPVANAGPDQGVGFGQTVVLDGTASADPDGKELSYRWNQAAGPDVTGGVGYLTGPTPSFTAPSEPATIDFSLVVSDGISSSAPDAVRIFVNEAQAGIFVGPAGSDSNPGTREAPLLTVAAAIAAASAAGGDVYLSRGTYSQSEFALASGVSLYGGFDEHFATRDPASNPTVLAGGPAAMTGSGVTDVRVDGLTVQSANATTPGGSSYAVLLRGCRDITVRQCVLQAGNGAAGVDAQNGAAGTPGVAGGDGSAGTCLDSLATGAGGAGADGAGFAGGAGGTGGTALTGYTGAPGGDGSGPGGGQGGEGGLITLRNHNGETGGAGANGQPGANGAGGPTFGALAASGYAPASGGDGAAGAGGSGGGGGGGSSGNIGDNGGSGNGGGGGGSGGGPGERGPGGGGGGGSFAVAVFASTNIDVRDCSLRTGLGGAGGAGGSGGTGGLGGPGGVEARECRSTVGAGGTGGAGGAGGRGGHGGGGGGGPTVGIAWDETSTLAQSGNSYTLGTAGIGGSSSGQNGAAGARQNTLQMPAAASASRQGFSASRQGLSGR